jgi:hypothetical protein
MGRHRDPDQSRDPLVQFDITLSLPRQLLWLLAGVAISHLDAFGGMAGKVGHILRALAVI